MSSRLKPKPRTLGELKKLNEAKLEIEKEIDRAKQLEAEKILQEKQAKAELTSLPLKELPQGVQADLMSYDIKDSGSVVIESEPFLDHSIVMGGVLVLVAIGFILLAKRL